MVTNGLAIEFAVLQHDINKYAPGIATFYIKALSSKEGLLEKEVVQTDNNNIVNNTNGLSIGKVELVSGIKLTVPLEIVRYFPTKIVPKGTVFLVAFVGGDLNKPTIIGRDVNGYYNS